MYTKKLRRRLIKNQANKQEDHYQAEIMIKMTCKLLFIGKIAPYLKYQE